MRVWSYGNDINTDMLFPGKYTYTCSAPEEILPHLLEDLDPSFAKEARAGDVIMAGMHYRPAKGNFLFLWPTSL